MKEGSDYGYAEGCGRQAVAVPRRREIEWRDYINVAVSHRPSASDESVEDAIEAELAPYWDDDEQGGTVWQLDLKQELSPRRG